MPKITKLAQGKRNPSRVNLYLDGKFAFSLDLETVIKRGLALGHDLPAHTIEELRGLSTHEKLFAKLISFISYRPRSQKEVLDRLKTYAPSLPMLDTKSLLNRLTDLGYLSDLEFARWFVKSRLANRPRSSRHLRQELYQKGISREVINQTLAELSDDRAALKALILKKSALSKDKLIAFLSRRGFSWEMIREELALGQS